MKSALFHSLPRPLRAREAVRVPRPAGGFFSEFAQLRNKATSNHRLRTNGALEESHSNERLRVSNWIVQRLYDYAVKETVER